MLIGLTGKMGSGKSEVVKFLKEKGYEHYVYSDVLKEMAKERSIEPTRANLQLLGAKIKGNDPGILSKALLKKARSDNAVFDGIRNRHEIKELKKKGVMIIAITAPQKVRYQRLKERKRPGDPETFEEFKRLDNLENRGNGKGQEINQCLKVSDHVVDNNSSIENLKENIAKIIR
ncbi:MAG TPA: AAA family ATPase [Candidatus Nanoarchaeia archaeon]|nr:AAA family ATPase [Candidatus Nanoarchaeia archaeon]